jgi:predicted RNase H-like nuclease (RuvC/YqgF family)
MVDRIKKPKRLDLAELAEIEKNFKRDYKGELAAIIHNLYAEIHKTGEISNKHNTIYDLELLLANANARIQQLAIDMAIEVKQYTTEV